MPTSNKNERTRAGCWTCRARRKKCDETRPHCLSCDSLGLECEGYGMRLKWGVSRAKVSALHSCKNNNVKKKMHSASPPTTLSSEERMPVPSEALVYHLGKDLYRTLTPLQLEIMQSCKFRIQLLCISACTYRKQSSTGARRFSWLASSSISRNTLRYSLDRSRCLLAVWLIRLCWSQSMRTL